MFKRKDLVVAVGLALSAMSMSAFACDPPVITNFSVGEGVVDGVATGVLQGNIPACNSGTYFPQVRNMVQGNPQLLFIPDAVYPGNDFEIPVIYTGPAVPVEHSGWAEIRTGSMHGDIVASTNPMPIVFSHANLPILANQAEFVSEEGGRVVTLSPPQNNNCPLTTNINLAKSQEENFCFLEFFPTGNATKMLTQNNDIIIGSAAIGSEQTVSWQISKFDYTEAKKQLATGNVTVDITPLTRDFTLSVSEMLQATQLLSATLAEQGTKLYTSAESAQAAAQNGEIAFFIDFTSIPNGLSVSASNGEILLSGKVMQSGELSIVYTPKRVLANGTVIAQAAKSITATATIPTSGVSVLASRSAQIFENFTVSPVINNGVCETVISSVDAVPPDGACVFTWTESGGLTENGTSLTESIADVGVVNTAWKVEYVFGQHRVELSAGSAAINVVNATQPTATVQGPATIKALNLATFDVRVPSCQSASTLVAATQLAEESGKPACFVSPTFAEDFELGENTHQNDPDSNVADSSKFLFSGIFSAAGQKTASFTIKKVLPNGAVIDSMPQTKNTTVNAHGMNYVLNAPVRARSTKAVSATFEPSGVACELTTDTSVSNSFNTALNQRKCLVSFTAPEAWTSNTAGLNGLMPEAGDVEVAWEVKYPLQTGDSITNILLASGSKTIVNYTPAAPVFRITAKKASDTILSTNSKGDLGALVIDQSTTGLLMNAVISDAENNVIAEINNLKLKDSKNLRLPEFSELGLFVPTDFKVKLSYAGEDSDIYSEGLIKVVRVPDSLPAIKFTAPKRAKIGETASVAVQLGLVSRGVYANDATKIGAWKVRLAKVNKDKTLTYLTEFQPVTASNGEATISLLASESWIGVPLVGVATLDTDFTAAAKTLQTTAFTVQQYIWPTFSLDVNQPSAFAPSAVRLRLAVSDQKFFGQTTEAANKVTYAWNFPENVEVVKIDGSTAFVKMNQAGQYEVSLDIADLHGNESTVLKTVQVSEAAPFVVNLKTFSANKWPGRAPASFTLRPEISGGHPQDKLTNYTLKVNGVEIHNAATPPKLLALPSAGEHAIEFAVASKMGATGTVLKTISLAPNQAPQCTLTQKVSRGVGSVVTKCTDVDGKVVRYNWVIDGVPKTANRNFYSFPVATGGSAVEVTAVDDAGAETKLTTTVGP